MLKKRWLAVLGLCLGIFFLLAAIKFTQIRAAIAFGESFPEASETVQSQRVSFSQWQPTIKVAGEVRAPKEVELRTETSGVIAKIGFESGAKVEEGTLLLQLDSAEEQARLAALKPQIKLAEKDYKRLSGIKNREAVSQQLIDQARSQLGVVQGEAASVRENITNKTITAPFTGRTGLHDFEVGEYINSGTLITRLVGENDELWVDFALPQQHATLNLGDGIIVSAEGLFDGAREGKVSVIEPALSRQTRSLSVRAVLPNLDKAITPGAFVNIATPIGQLQTVVRLPSTAVRTNSFGDYVFLLEKDAKNQWRAKRKPVSVLAKVENDTILKPSLTKNDIVATLGAYKLREGLLVNIESDGGIEQPNAPETFEAIEKTSIAPEINDE